MRMRRLSQIQLSKPVKPITNDSIATFAAAQRSPPIRTVELCVRHIRIEKYSGSAITNPYVILDRGFLS